MLLSRKLLCELSPNFSKVSNEYGDGSRTNYSSS